MNFICYFRFSSFFAQRNIFVCYVLLLVSMLFYPLAAQSLFDRKNNTSGMNTQQLLTAQRAFIPDVTLVDEKTLHLNWTIHPDYYLYKEKFKFSIAPNSLQVVKVELPRGKDYEDEFFGLQEIYDQPMTLVLHLEGQWQQKEATLTIQAQGCAKQGLCYPPEEWKIPIIYNAEAISLAQQSSLLDSVENNRSALIDASLEIVEQGSEKIVPVVAATVSEHISLHNALQEYRYWALPLFFLLGVMLSFTPCVLPMLPIVSSLIAGSQSITPRKSFLLALVYVLSASLTYSLMGMIAGYFGANLSAILQNPWIILPFVGVFILLAANMFDLVQLRMPNFIRAPLHQMANRHRGGRLLSVSMMGIFSALIIGPCIAPPLAGILLLISQSKDLVLGGVTLFVMSLGMGVPIIILGTSYGHFLPKAGAWMNQIKYFFGYMLLALAIYLLSRLIDAIYIQVLSTLLMIYFAFWLLSLPVKRWVIAQRSVVFILLSLSFYQGQQVFYVIFEAPAYALNSSTKVSMDDHIIFTPVQTIAEFEAALLAAEGKKVMLEFSADWCIACKEMEKYTFSDPEVRKTMRQMVLLQVDVTEHNADDRAFYEQFNVFGPPAMLFFNENGQALTQQHVMGFMNAKKFNQHLQSL